MIGKEYPEAGWVKVNVDAAVNGITSTADVGGLMRNGEGACMARFQGCIGRTSVLSAELWAIWYGLDLAREMGQCRMILESDSVEAIETAGVDHPYYNLVTCARRMLILLWAVRVVHILL